MHTACFQAFEESLFSFLKNQSRSKGWSDRQRSQNLWTRKGYELVFKACECSCGKGHLRKDLEWCLNSSEMSLSESHTLDASGDAKRKRKKSRSGGAKPNNTITIGLPSFSQVRKSINCIFSRACHSLKKHLISKFLHCVITNALNFVSKV